MLYSSFPLAICFTRVVYTCQYYSPNLSLPPMSTGPFSTSVSLLLPCRQVHLYHFCRFHIYVLIHICFSPSDLFHFIWKTLGPSTSTNDPFHFFLWLISHYIYVPNLLYPFICWWAFRLLLCPGYHWLDGCESEWTPGVSDGQGGLACCDSWGHKESATTERLNWTEAVDIYLAPFSRLSWFS